jgi:hypothetical protein
VTALARQTLDPTREKVHTGKKGVQMLKDEELAKYGEKYDGVWSWALAKSGDSTPRTGKWMLWPQGEEAIEVWHVVCELTCSHKLGIQAKMSCEAGRELLGERLICVYTYDSDDLQDVQRVVDTLRRCIDPKHRLIYKEDSMTGQVSIRVPIDPFQNGMFTLTRRL